MKKDYVITNQELIETQGIDLNELCTDSSYVPTTIIKGLNIAVTRICKLCDNIQDGELGIEEILDKNPRKVPAFKKLQGTIIYNMIMTGETAPTEGAIDDIISNELNIGKINGIQKGYYRK